MKKFVFLICSLFLLIPLSVSAKSIQKQKTVAVTVNAEVPDDWNGDVLLVYQKSDGSGPEYSFELNRDNDYCLRQMIFEGDYQCIKKQAEGCRLATEDSVFLSKGSVVNVVVQPNSSTEELSVSNSEPINFTPSEDNDWWKIGVGILVLGTVLAGIVLVKSK